MTARFLTEQDVDALLTVPECIPLIEAAMREFGLGQAANQPRRRLRSAGYSMQVMAAAHGAAGVAGLKVYGGGQSAAGVRAATPMKVFLYSTQTGELLAVVAANCLGQIRTGAATGVATKYLARPDAATVGIYGAGSQARTQLEAVCAVRTIRSVKVYTRTAEHREVFAAEMSAKLGIEVQPVAQPEHAAQACDIVVTITNAQQPVLQGAWLEAGAHVNAAGGTSLIRGEVDAEAVGRAAVVVADSVEDARLECADLMRAVEAGALNWEQVRELGHVVAGLIPGRVADADITLFESQGLALWDVAAAALVYHKAKEHGIGAPLPF